MGNARLTERAPFVAEVDVLVAGTDAPRRVWGTDVSETGIFLQTTHPFRVGDRVSLRFDVDDQEVHVRAATVRWVRPFQPINVDGSVPGIGVHFVAVDPPARSALRQFVRPRAQDLDWRAELASAAAATERADAASLRFERTAFSLPQSEPDVLRDAANAEDDDRDVVQSTRPMLALDSLPPPQASLPPLTGSIVAAARGERASGTPREVTSKLVAFSLPPFSALPQQAFQPTRADASSARAESPRAVSMQPAAEVDAFRGWSFAKDNITGRPVANTTLPAALAASFDAAVTVPGAPGGPAGADEGALAVGGLNLSFADDAPDGRGPKHGSLVAHATVHPIAHAIVDDAMSQPPLQMEVPFERALNDAVVSLNDLPAAGERRAGRDRPRALPRSRALPLALGLLCAGTAVGALVGVVQKRVLPAVSAARVAAAPLRAPTSSSPPTTQATAAGLAGTEAPAAHAVDIPAAATPQTQPPAPQVRSVAEVERELTSARPAPVAALQPTIADLQARPQPPSQQARSSSVVVGAPPQTRARADATDDTRVRFPVGNAEVARAFALSNPARIVVDFARAELPKAPLVLDKNGVHRVRFGEPTQGHPRAVLELLEDKKPAHVDARVSGGALVVTYH